MVAGQRSAAKATDQIRGVSTTKPSPLLRSSMKIRKAGDEVEAEPGFFAGDTVAHCGPTLKGEFARTLNLTCVHTGWMFTRTVRNNAHIHILGALKAGVDEVPFEVTGLDFDNGTEFLNHAVIKWAGEMEIFFTRSRPYKKNDQATIESKNNRLVRNYGFYYRYDTPHAHHLAGIPTSGMDSVSRAVLVMLVGPSTGTADLRYRREHDRAAPRRARRHRRE